MAPVGRLPSFAAGDSSHSAAYSLNVGNLHDTGLSAEATPPAASADNQPVWTGPPRPMSLPRPLPTVGRQAALGGLHSAEKQLEK